MNEFFYKHEYNTIEEMSVLITEKSAFENLPTPFKEAPTNDGADIRSAEPNVPGYFVESVAKYFTTCQRSAVHPKRL
jgi:hypothetical protein